MKFLVKVLRILATICTPITFVLAVLWIIYPARNFEPFTVALGSISVIFFWLAQYLENKLGGKKVDVTQFDRLTTIEVLEIVEQSNPNDWDVNFSQSAEIAVYKEYPSLRIETHHKDEFIHNDDFYENWANSFLDSHARSYYYHVYVGATRLKEFILVSVDGGRALLPLPKNPTDLSVEKIRYKIALIFDQFGSCDEYMKRAGLYLAK